MSKPIERMQTHNLSVTSDRLIVRANTVVCVKITDLLPGMCGDQ